MGQTHCFACWYASVLLSSKAYERRITSLLSMAVASPSFPSYGLRAFHCGTSHKPETTSALRVLTLPDWCKFQPVFTHLSAALHLLTSHLLTWQGILISPMPTVLALLPITCWQSIFFKYPEK